MVATRNDTVSTYRVGGDLGYWGVLMLLPFWTATQELCGIFFEGRILRWEVHCHERAFVFQVKIFFFFDDIL